MIRILILTSILTCLNFFSKAQDNLIGKWQLKIDSIEAYSPVSMELIIGIPEKSIIYPATLRLEYENKNTTYELMLAKKNNGKLYLHSLRATSSNNNISEINPSIYLNGCFKQKNDLKGNTYLTLERLSNYENRKETTTNDSFVNACARYFKMNFLTLKKVNNETLDKITADKILQPKYSKFYLGLIDTIFVNSSEAGIEFTKNKDNDLISVQLNGNTIADNIDSKKSRDNAKISLDTGLNILCFFADDEGSIYPFSSGSLKLLFSHYIKGLSFNDAENTGANFIAVRIYIQGSGTDNEEDKNIFHEIDRKSYEDSSITKKTYNSDPTNLLLKEATNAGDFVTHSPQLTFAIWDDALEDGDSISLSVNDIWITRTFPVKKNPQFLTITLKPGTNVITFAANNLGSIPPNTSVLEIIDGKKRKSFYIETDMNHNNLVRIFYDIK